MSTTDTSHLVALGNSKTEYRYNQPGVDLLEVFENPFCKFDKEPLPNLVVASGKVHIEVPEFTSLCPLTGQPDFATIVIDYTPAALCVESKSLKLYLMAFRNEGEFHEACVARIAHDLWTVLMPLDLRVEGRFTPRGGIPFWPTAYLSRY